VHTVITAALWNAYFPAFARSHDRSAEALALSREYLGLLAWIGLPIAALGWALGRHIVDLLYGHAFAPSGRYFEWLCLTVGLTFLNYGLVATLVPWGRSGLQLKITASAALLNLVVNVLAVPFYGPWGAIAATVAAELLVVIFGVISRRRLRLFWHPILPVIGPPLLCSVAVATGLAAMPASFDRMWWAELPAAAAVLGACLISFEGRTLLRLWRTLRLRENVN
jgi:O-antigen/teichoic acid export membrane protein